MSKKNLFKAAGIAIAAVGAIGLGTGSSPVGQEVVTAAQNTQIVQKAQQAKRATAKQQTQQQQTQQSRVLSKAVYLPFGDGDRIYGKFTLSPREYGEYLARSGKNKYNNRCRKHWAKAFA